MISEKIGLCIQELAKGKNMSMYRLAQNAAISQSTLSNILHRQNAPEIETLERICKGLGMTIAEFFTYLEARYIGSSTSDTKSILEQYLTLSPVSRRFVMESLQYALHMEHR